MKRLALHVAWWALLVPFYALALLAHAFEVALFFRETVEDELEMLP